MEGAEAAPRGAGASADLFREMIEVHGVEFDEWVRMREDAAQAVQDRIREESARASSGGGGGGRSAEERDPVREATESTVQRRTGELVEAFLRGGMPAATALRREFASIDDALK